MRLGIVLVWILLLAAGAVAILLRQPSLPSAYTARRDLPAGYLLDAGDLAPVPLDGRYLRHEVKKGEMVGAGDVGPAPPLTQEAGVLPVVFAVPRDRVALGTLNVGSAVKLCRAGQVSIPSARVRTLLCRDADEPCLLVVGISPADADKAAPEKAGARVTVQQPSDTCPGG